MKILVTVTEVAVVDDEFEIDGLAVDERYLTYDLNEWDDYAVEEAVQYKEAHEDDDVEVVTVTVGPERAEETIRQALAKGADRAIRVWDDALADASVRDPATKAAVLAAVAREEDPDLVLSGVQSGDDAFGATGVALAAALDYEWAAVVNDLELDAEAGVASVHRELEGGVEELTDVEIPAVFTIQTGINEPRYVGIRGIRKVASVDIPELGLSDLGLSADQVGETGSRVKRVDYFVPEMGEGAEILEGDTEEVAAKLIDMLKARGGIK